MRAKSLMSLKVWSNLGLAKEKSKSAFVHDFFIYVYKSIDLKWLFEATFSSFHNFCLS